MTYCWLERVLILGILKQKDINFLWATNFNSTFANYFVYTFFFTEEDNTSSNYGVDLADEDTKVSDDYVKSPYGLHSVPFS